MTDKNLTFSYQKRVAARVKNMIRSDIHAYRTFAMFRAEIERSDSSEDAALQILVMLAAEPSESQKLIQTIREPRDISYDRSY